MAAAKDVFERLGWSGATMRAVADQASVSVKTVEALYRTKAELLKAAANPLSVYGSGHRPYYQNVVKVLRGEAAPDTNGREGRKSLELILAMYESARAEREIALPLRAFSRERRQA